ncbi:peptidylprolyl isomerase, partial [Patescibacteria group bacterium]|nr:peptidylprolyl isomerase [Patescibacteria group bacterium]
EEPDIKNPTRPKSSTIKIGGAILGIFLLLGGLVGARYLVQKQKVGEKRTQAQNEQVKTKEQNQTNTSQLDPNSILPDSPVSLFNNNQVDPKVYSEALAYDKNVWRSDIESEQAKKLVNQRVFERLLLYQEAKKQGWVITDEEKSAAEKRLFGENIHANLRLYPEFNRQIEAEAIKEKIRQELTSWRAGEYIRLRYTGVGSEAVRNKGQNPKTIAQTKINEIKNRLDRGEAFSSLRAELNNDSDLMDQNDGEEMLTFNYLTLDSSLFDDPDFNKKVLDLNVNEISKIFTMQLMDHETNKYIDYAFVIIKTTGGINGSYSSYKNWLDKSFSQTKYQ